MAVTINDIKKLRDMTGAGLSDCKKALIESDNDITKAMELIRKRGQVDELAIRLVPQENQ